jgi:hypothetical protein
MNIHDLTPEEREVYRQAWIGSLNQDPSATLCGAQSQVMARADAIAEAAALLWRWRCSQEAAQVGEGAADVPSR